MRGSADSLREEAEAVAEWERWLVATDAKPLIALAAAGALFRDALAEAGERPSVVES